MVSTPIVFKLLTLIVAAALVGCIAFFYTGGDGAHAASATPPMLEACLLSIL